MASFDVEKFDRFVDIVKGARRAVALTGAGISVPSGIPDFRSATGLYHTKYGDFDPETMLSHGFFETHPDEFFRFYKEKMIYPSAEPNDAHFLLAELEKRGVLTAVITQNIDGLHQKAGSKNVLELHGAVRDNTCVRCGAHYPLQSVTNCDGVPHCDCGGVIKPDVVLYGESLNNRVVRAALNAVENADTLIVIGTSLLVYPAAGLVDYFYGDTAVVINKGATSFDGSAQLLIDADCALVARYALERL